MVLANILCVAPGCEEFPHGVTEVDGVPIFDVISAAVRMAEVLVSMKRAGIPWISRKRTFKQPSEDVVRAAAANFPYHGSGSWHY